MALSDFQKSWLNASMLAALLTLPGGIAGGIAGLIGGLGMATLLGYLWARGKHSH